MLRAGASRVRGAAVLGFLILASPFIVRGSDLIVRYYSVDDTFYYLQIARNLANGHGSTFDGVSVTNGYQLLWQGLLVPLAFVFRGRDALLEATILLACALVAGAAYVLARLCGSLCEDERSRGLASLVALGAVVVLAFKSATGLLSGMESALAFLVLVLFAWSLLMAYDQPEVNRRTTALSCTFAVLLVFCRQDYAIVAGSLVVSLLALRLVQRRSEPVRAVLREEGVKWLAVLAAVPLGLIISFVLYFAIGRTAVPVSGLVKLRRGVPQRLSALPGRFVNALFPFNSSAVPRSALNLIGILAVMIVAAFLIWNRRHLRAPRLARAAVSAGITLVIYCAFMSLSLGEIPFWYLAIAVYFYAVFATTAVVELRAMFAEHGSGERVFTGLFAMGGIALLAFSAVTSVLFSSKSDVSALYSARRDLGRTLASSAPACRFAAFNAGQLGYFSGGRFVNLDGLVNSNGYRLHVLGNATSLEAYLRERKINRLVDYTFGWADPILRGYTVIASRPAGRSSTLEVLAAKGAPSDGCRI